MATNDEAIDVFVKLGLTQLQARTYFALAKLGTAEVSYISKYSNVARQDIYRIMPTLQKIGLAEKVISTPVTFKATPWKNGISLLLERRTQEQAELEKRTKTLFAALEEKTVSTENNPDFQFTILYDRNLFLKRMETAILEAKESKYEIMPSASVKIMTFYHLKAMAKAQKKGVKFRIIIDKPDSNTLESVQSLKQNLQCELKYVSTPVQVASIIYDHTEVNIRITADSLVPSLWTNNSQVVRLAEIYFESMWKEAKPLDELERNAGSGLGRAVKVREGRLIELTASQDKQARKRLGRQQDTDTRS